MNLIFEESINTQSMETIDLQSIGDTKSIEKVDWQSIGKDDRKKMITAYIKSNPKSTSLQIAQLTKLSQMRVRTILQELVADGVIEKIGNYRHTSYQVKNNNE